MPAMSSGSPMRFSGFAARICVAEALERHRHHLALEGPGRDRVDGDLGREAPRQVLREVVERRLARSSRRRSRGAGPEMPSIEPMLMTRAGSPGRAAARSWGSSATVSRKAAFTLRASTLSKAASGYCSRGAPQLAPALFTSTWRRGSCAASASASATQPAGVPRVGRHRHGRCRPSRARRPPRRTPRALARGDVDLGARLDEAAGDHQADAPRPAGHERHLAFDGEELLHVHRGSSSRWGTVARGGRARARPPLAQGTGYFGRPARSSSISALNEGREWMRSR